MKKFIISSALLLLATVQTWACGPFLNTHNKYLFSIYHRNVLYGPMKVYDTQTFWKQYTQSRDSAFSYEKSHADIVSTAKSRNDRELLSYMHWLDAYQAIVRQLQDTWTYPTKAQLASRKVTISKMLQACTAYRGSRLRQQYLLLRMRANMISGNYASNLALWNRTASRMKAGVYQEWMRGIYANALFKTGKMLDAADIYAQQGDMASLRYCVSKYRSYAGIRSIYAQRPNSPVLDYLVEDFVNSAQETIDCYANPYESGSSTKDIEEVIKANGCSPKYEKEVNDFVAFASQVIAEGKVKDPCMWKTAQGTLCYLFGRQDEAMKALDAAMTLEGSSRSKDNARAIRLVASARSATLNGDYENYLVKEFQWLEQAIKADGGVTKDYIDNHYEDVLSRLVYQTLAKRYAAQGNLNMSLALRGMLDELGQSMTGSNYSPDQLHTLFRYDDGTQGWNGDYNGEYAESLDSLTADQFISYYNFLTTSHSSQLEQYLASRTYRNAEYFNDRIGTCLLREGRFAEAIPYLSRVSLAFMNQQNISGYMAKNDFETPRWFRHQKVDWDQMGPETGTLTRNPKLAFAKKMVALLQQADAPLEVEEKLKLDYQLATLYYQASHEGDCWFLTRYGKNFSDSICPGEKDFVAEAMWHLERSKQSVNENLKASSLYALAFIPDGPWADVQYKWNDNLNVSEALYTVHPAARQFLAMAELKGYLSANTSSFIAPLASRCDVLRQFSKHAGLAGSSY
jgi:hypothetical protein